MSEVDIADQIAAAEAYEELHVPALFAEWAPQVLDGARVSTGDRVLDIACGTGVVTREAVGRVGDTGSVTGLDPMAGMLEVAARHAPGAGFQNGVAESLPFADESFDAVVSQFGMMFFTDRQKAVEEMLRVSRRGGRIAVAVWAALEQSEAYPEEVEMIERLAGKAAADALRAPFNLGDTDQLETLFASAGAADVSVSVIRRDGKVPQRAHHGRSGLAGLAASHGRASRRSDNRDSAERIGKGTRKLHHR